MVVKEVDSVASRLSAVEPGACARVGKNRARIENG
jgi:hypothetical protein